MAWNGFLTCCERPVTKNGAPTSCPAQARIPLNPLKVRTMVSFTWRPQGARQWCQQRAEEWLGQHGNAAVENQSGLAAPGKQTEDARSTAEVPLTRS